MLWYAIALSALVVSVSGHGRVIQPPSRASAWRFGFPTAADYDDDGRNCGGFFHQHSVNGGKCGICGDPYDQPQPRHHEIGGIYGAGVIVADYKSGELITATVIITAYHRGYWEFKICPDPYRNDQACFDQYILELEEGGTKYYPKGEGQFTMKYRLPARLTCEHCVLQWRYTAGNNWGVCQNGTQGLGCGNQEQFGACSDITISIPVQNADDKPYPLSDNQRLGYFDVQALLHLLRTVSPRPNVRVGPLRPDIKFSPHINKNKKRKRKGKKTKPRKRKKIKNELKVGGYKNNSMP
ncbi:unnamed protein product [Parnassius mnemosyne]|uniref:Chitin-binding type-4 domain-containing protein n=1 Tax=Parnassius mnemosyne TaxID=213953 RepID=A0AAV1KW65_9NEOP